MQFVTGRNAGIAVTHGAILRCFALQARYVPPIIAKFGMAKGTEGFLCL